MNMDALPAGAPAKAVIAAAVATPLEALERSRAMGINWSPIFRVETPTLYHTRYFWCVIIAFYFYDLLSPPAESGTIAPDSPDSCGLVRIFGPRFPGATEVLSWSH